jgi:hypothetical protein
MTISCKILPRMRNVLDKICRQDQNTHFMFSNFFPKIASFMKKCGKIWWSQRGHKWRRYMVHTCCMLDKQGYTHARACTRPRSRALAHKHAHRQISNTYCFPRQQQFLKRATALRRTHTVCPVYTRQHCSYLAEMRDEAEGKWAQEKLSSAANVAKIQVYRCCSGGIWSYHCTDTGNVVAGQWHGVRPDTTYGFWMQVPLREVSSWPSTKLQSFAVGVENKWKSYNEDKTEKSEEILSIVRVVSWPWLVLPQSVSINTAVSRFGFQTPFTTSGYLF